MMQVVSICLEPPVYNEKLLLSIISLFFILTCFSETIQLKNGGTLEAIIVEKTDTCIKTDIGGLSLTYYLDDIESINGISQSSKKGEINPPAAEKITAGEKTQERIPKILKHLGYPENTWPGIEQELTAFLSKIDFPARTRETAKAKSNPEQLKQFVAKVGSLIQREGCLNPDSPHPLVKLLITGVDAENIFRLIEASPIDPEKKEKLTRLLVSCSAVSQLGSILLELLDINVKTVFASDHVFNCVPLEGRQVLFIDFLNQFFDSVDLTQYYTLEGSYWVFKKEHRLAPEKVQETIVGWLAGERTATLAEILNAPLYRHVYITDGYTVTASIYNNYGTIYDAAGDYADAIAYYRKSIDINPDYADPYYNRGNTLRHQDDPSQALLDYDKTIALNPDYTEAYNNRGIVNGDLGNFSGAIADHTRAIEIAPDRATAYVNRGVAHFQQGNLPQSISDFTKAIGIDPHLVEAYKNRAIAYAQQGEFDHALRDCAKAIEIDPNYTHAYRARAGIYLRRNDFDKAWEDVHKVESLGGKIEIEFLNELKKPPAGKAKDICAV